MDNPAKKIDRKRFLRLGGIGAAAAVAAPAASAHAAPAAPDTSLVFNVKDYGARGDGQADDTAGITAAIQAAAGGGTVYFPPGNFKVNGELLIQSNNIVVRGAGWASQLTQIDTSAQGKATLRFVDRDAVAVRDLSFVGRGTEHDGANTDYNGVAAVRFDKCTNVTVSGCRITGHAGGGIRWTKSLTGALFAENTITGVGGAPGTGPIKRKDNNNDFAIGQWRSTASDNITIRDNTISGHCFGIGSGYGVGLVISGNIIHSIPGQHGMYLSAPSSAQLSGNVVRNVALNCINVQIAESAPNTVASLAITGNVLHDAASGIVLNIVEKLTDPDGPGFLQPVVASNSIRTVSEYGIAVNRTRNGSIHGNTVSGTGAYGLLLNGFSGTVRDNTVLNTNWNGLYVDLIGDTYSSGNVFTDCALNTTSATVEPRLAYYVNAVRTIGTAVPVFHSDSDVLHAIAAEPATLQKCLRSSAGTAVFLRGLVNRTTKPWEFKGELLHLDFAYSQTADFSDLTDAAHLNPTTPVYGRGRRELYGTQDPAAAGMTAFFRQGDTCWNAKPVAGGPPGWVCVAAGTPGTWKAMAELAG